MSWPSINLRRGKGPLTVAKNQQLFPCSNRYLSEQWEQIEGDAQRVFTHDAGRMCASRVKVSEESSIMFVGGMRSVRGGIEVIASGFGAFGVDVVSNDEFDGRFGAAVDIGGLDRTLFRDGNHIGKACDIAIHGGRRGEDNLGDVMAGH